MDARANFCKVVVNTAYNGSDTSITISPSDPNLASLPDPAVSGAYNLTWWNWTTYKDPADDPDKEIVRVTSKTSNVLTVVRAQEGTIASTKNTASSTYKMALSLTKKWLDDIDDASADVGEETKWVTDKTTTGGAGALGNGTADDSVPIQNHFTNGAYIIFPPGTYLLSNITGHSNMLIRGAGVGVTTVKLKDTAGAASMFVFTSESNITFEDMTIDGNKAYNATAVDGLGFATCSNVTVRNVEIKNCKRHNINFGGTTTNSIAFSCISTGADNSSFNIDGDNNMIVSCRMSGSATGIAIAGGTDDTIIRDCHIAAATTKVSNSGTNTHSRGNVGWKTFNVVESASIDVSASAELEQTIAHGLDVTPAKKNVLIGHYRDTGTNVYGSRGPYVKTVDATNVVCSFNVTAGAATTTAKMVLTIDALP